MGKLSYYLLKMFSFMSLPLTRMGKKPLTESILKDNRLGKVKLIFLNIFLLERKNH